MPRPQVTRSARILYGLAAVFFAVALVAVFILGGWALAQGLARIGWLEAFPVAALVYAGAFGWLCYRARL